MKKTLKKAKKREKKKVVKKPAKKAGKLKVAQKPKKGLDKAALKKKGGAAAKVKPGDKVQNSEITELIERGRPRGFVTDNEILLSLIHI